MRFKAILAALTAVSALSSASADAAVLHDQLLTDFSDVGAIIDRAMLSQRFEASFSSFDVAALDDFTLNQRAKITTISAQFFDYGFDAGHFDPADIQNYQIGIFSSPAAGQASLTGDVANVILPSADVTVTPEIDNSVFSGIAGFYRVRASVDFTLNAGTYWLGFVPRYDASTGGETSMLAGDGSFGADAVEVNPAGGFGSYLPTYPPSRTGFSIEGDVLSAAPEPASWALMIGGFGLAGAMLRTQRRRAAA